VAVIIGLETDRRRTPIGPARQKRRQRFVACIAAKDRAIRRTAVECSDLTLPAPETSPCLDVLLQVTIKSTASNVPTGAAIAIAVYSRWQRGVREPIAPSLNSVDGGSRAPRVTY